MHEGDKEFAQNVGGQNLNVCEHLVGVGENINIYLKYIGICAGLNSMIWHLEAS